MARNCTNSVEVSNAAYRYHRSRFHIASNTYAAAATRRPFTFSSWKSRATIKAAMIVWRITALQRRAIIIGRVMMQIGWDILRIPWRATCHTLCQHKSPMSSRKEERSLRRCYPCRVSSMHAPSQRFRRFWGERAMIAWLLWESFS